jgi:hypothetical protein
MHCTPAANYPLHHPPLMSAHATVLIKHPRCMLKLQGLPSLLLDASIGAQFCLLSDLATVTSDDTSVRAAVLASTLFGSDSVSDSGDAVLFETQTSCEQAYRDLLSVSASLSQAAVTAGSQRNWTSGASDVQGVEFCYHLVMCQAFGVEIARDPSGLLASHLQCVG